MFTLLQTEISRIVGSCHVGTSNVKAIKHVVNRLGKRIYFQQPKELRKQIMQFTIKQHEENFKTYCLIMGGF